MRSPSWNRTACRTCSVQYSGERNCSAVAGSPVTLEITVISGSCAVNPATTVPNSASIGSISGEWNAWLTRSRRVRRPRPAQSASSSVMSSSAPETTTVSEAFTAATDTRRSRPASQGARSCSVPCTDSIAPPSGSAAIRRPLAATSRTASGSDHTPATCAALISPIECPSSRSGRTPQECISRNSATSTANRAAWA
ncbi:hypothetical protein DF18_34430 [Streptomyces rimosus]|nr:hypothetical protein DF18_34430 [Streptomyces rimosus]